MEVVAKQRQLIAEKAKRFAVDVVERKSGALREDFGKTPSVQGVCIVQHWPCTVLEQGAVRPSQLLELHL